jgi:hypothetical protein
MCEVLHQTNLLGSSQLCSCQGAPSISSSSDVIIGDPARDLRVSTASEKLLDHVFDHCQSMACLIRHQHAPYHCLPTAFLPGFGAADTASNRPAMSWQELLPHIGARAGEGRAGRACMLGVAVIIFPFSAVFTVARSATMACHAMRAYQVRRHAKHQADVDVGWLGVNSGASDVQMLPTHCTPVCVYAQATT